MLLITQSRRRKQHLQTMEVVAKRRRLVAQPTTQFLNLPFELVHLIATFLPHRANVVIDLCSVCRAWRQAFLQPGAFKECSVFLGLPSMMKNLWLLQGVAEVHAEVNCDELLYRAPRSVQLAHNTSFEGGECDHDDIAHGGALLEAHCVTAYESLRKLPHLHSLTLHVAGVRLPSTRKLFTSSLFASMGSLRVLDLKSKFELGDLLKPLAALRELTLRDFRGIGRASLKTLTALQALHLSHCVVPQESFQDMRRVRRVTCDGVKFIHAANRFKLYNARWLRTYRVVANDCGHGDPSFRRVKRNDPTSWRNVAHIEWRATLADHAEAFASLTRLVCPYHRNATFYTMVNGTHGVSKRTHEWIAASQSLEFPSNMIRRRFASTILPTMSNLRELQVCSATITGRSLQQLTALRSLDIQGCINVGDAGLCRLTALTKLCVAECPRITDKAFPPLAILRELDVSSTAITGMFLSCVPTLTTLTWVHPRSGVAGLNLGALWLHRSLSTLFVSHDMLQHEHMRLLPRAIKVLVKKRRWDPIRFMH